MNLRRWWLPSVGAWLWLLLFLGLQLSPRRAGLRNDGDPCWHWLQGNWMLEHRAILRTDFLSHTRASAPLVCKDWGSEVLWAVAGNLFGWSGVLFLASSLIATTAWLLYRQLRAEETDALLAGVLSLLAAWVCSSHWLARPHLMTHLLASLMAWTLRDFDRDRLGVRQAGWRVAVLMLAWANVHGGFFTGFMMIGLYLIGCIVGARTRKLLGFGTLAVIAVAASLVNPNGWQLHAQIVSFLRTPALALSTNEWQPADFHGATMLGFVTLWVVLAVTLAVVRPRLGTTDLVMVAGWGISALRVSRNVAIFAIVVTPILAEHLRTALRGSWWRRLCERTSAFDRVTGGGAVVALTIVTMLFVIAKPVLVTALPANEWPAEAVRFLRDNTSSMRGQMFNEYIWSGYLGQELPGRKVFIDGRNDFYGLEFAREYSAVSQGQPGWKAVLEKYGVGWTILPRACRLNVALAAEGTWNCVHSDEVAMVWRKGQ